MNSPPSLIQLRDFGNDFIDGLALRAPSFTPSIRYSITHNSTIPSMVNTPPIAQMASTAQANKSPHTPNSSQATKPAFQQKFKRPRLVPEWPLSHAAKLDSLNPSQTHSSKKRKSEDPASRESDKASRSQDPSQPSVSEKRKSLLSPPLSTDIASRSRSATLGPTSASRKPGRISMTNPVQAQATSKSSTTATPAHENSPVKKIKTEPGAIATESKEPEKEKNDKNSDESDYDTIIFVYVGEDLKKVGIHKGLLIKASSFFREQLLNTSENVEDNNTEDKDSTPSSDASTASYEGNSKAVALPSEDVAIFKRFNDWLYTDKMITKSETPKDLPWTAIVDTYVFAVRRGIPRLQNSCIDISIQKIDEGGLFPNQVVINNLWKTHGAVWNLRKLFLQLFAVKCNLKNALAGNQGYCQRFLHDLNILQFNIIQFELKKGGKRGGEVDIWKGRTKYHVYKEENPIAID